MIARMLGKGIFGIVIPENKPEQKLKEANSFHWKFHCKWIKHKPKLFDYRKQTKYFVFFGISVCHVMYRRLDAKISLINFTDNKNLLSEWENA